MPKNAWHGDGSKSRTEFILKPSSYKLTYRCIHCHERERAPYRLWCKECNQLLTPDEKRAYGEKVRNKNAKV